MKSFTAFEQRYLTSLHLVYLGPVVVAPLRHLLELLNGRLRTRPPAQVLRQVRGHHPDVIVARHALHGVGRVAPGVPARALPLRVLVRLLAEVDDVHVLLVAPNVIGVDFHPGARVSGVYW